MPLLPFAGHAPEWHRVPAHVIHNQLEQCRHHWYLTVAVLESWRTMTAETADRLLKKVNFGTEYRSDSSDLVTDFYLPCLERSVLYRRAVGYFTSHGLSVAARGLATLVTSGGRMRLVASPLLAPEDLEAIRTGYLAREDAITRALIRSIDNVAEDLVKDRLSVLAWLVAEERLEVRIAIPFDANAVKQGIYHEKLGIFSDAADNVVVFTGSPNETAGGLVENFEAIDVFCSWDDPQSRVGRKVENFERLWSNTTSGLTVLDFPEAAREKLLSYRRPGRTRQGEQENPVPNRWRHQDEAVTKFLDKERGVLHMATGTGKTRTALKIVETLVSANTIDTIIVSADGTDLLQQWHAELLKLVPELQQRFPVYRHYDEYRDRDRFTLNPHKAVLLASRPVLPPVLRALGPRVGARTLLIHDEVHRLGSPANRTGLASLSDNIRFRLGLSATPEREYDAEGTQFIESHVGPVIFSFELGDAIRRGILSPFNYYPLEYVPDDNDRRRLQDVYRRAEARERAGDPMSEEEKWIELAKVHKTSLAKLPVFAAFLEDHPDILARCIIFVETQEYGEAVLRIIHRYRHDFHTYYTGEASDTLRRFAAGELECLITCHRLSEGIDIRSINTVVLFSSARAPLETVQRIGRCLRTNPSEPAKRANVIDFIKVDPDSEDEPDDDDADNARRLWLEGLSRIEQEVDQ